MHEWFRKLMIAFNVILIVFFCASFSNYPLWMSMSSIGMAVFVIVIFRGRKNVLIPKNTCQKKWQCILAIDDDPVFQKLIKVILMKEGYSVLTADTGEIGISIAEQQQPDLILLDVILPGVKGRAVCKILQANEKTKHIPVVFLTAKFSPDDVKAELEAGARAHLTKPVNTESLLSMVCGLLGSNKG